MQNPSAPNVFLASSSRYRRELLARVLDSFEAVAPGVDEANPDGLEADALAAHLARRKAEAISANAPAGLIIGADQVAVLDGTLLGKPGSHQKAVEQLLACSGKTVRFLTAVCVLDPQSRSRHEHTDVTIVRFRSFDRRLAEAYLRRDEPYDCAGSFKVEGAGVVLFDAVESVDPTALIGLPMIWLSARLLELNYLAP
jgi:septum formation protein